MEVLAIISKQVAEMNRRMGGMEERLVQVENENRRKEIQPEYEEIRRASVHSTTLAPRQAHNQCSPPQSRTQNYQCPIFQNPNPPNHLRQPTPHPIPQPYHPPQENLLFVANQIQYQTPFRNDSIHLFMNPTHHIHKMHHKSPTKTTNTKILSMMKFMRSSIMMNFGSMGVGMEMECKGKEYDLGTWGGTKAWEIKNMEIKEIG
ncbi:hypothetical protein KY290_005194 [Solanum tuberosum]|uniref:Uncharacterized protein n=1 Tax=Solanum tuberosum TaxID=4113 RepID=A0ABQ7WDE9_SOLTU|nr:hypothetical protein KY289_005583 [Solanum tuberosum]KAH0751926.1 hypothetical protein KY285_005074 [Solanum tuberosum]KAH0778767.1 hypothetical protein KY290_005194 [Solanum tuberosum]